jgi:hypothetical protein
MHRLSFTERQQQVKLLLEYRGLQENTDKG